MRSKLVILPEPNTAFDLRDFQLADEQAVIKLWQTCKLLWPWNNPHRYIRRKLAFSDGGFWVGHVGPRLIASIMVGYDGHRGSVNYLAIDPAFSGRGFGRLLMKRAEAFLSQTGVRKSIYACAGKMRLFSLFITVWPMTRVMWLFSAKG